MIVERHWYSLTNKSALALAAGSVRVERLRVAYQVEWDVEKAEVNLKKHGVSFTEASTVFGDPLALFMPDPDHSAEEDCFLLLGQSSLRTLLVVSFAERPPATRLISARPATDHERRTYEEDV